MGKMRDLGSAVTPPQVFWSDTGGRWASEKLARCLKEGRPMTPSELRTNETLQKDEWKHYDDQLIEEASIRLVGVADLMAGGLVRPVPNSMGKTIFEYEKMTDMNPATVSLNGLSRMDDDRVEFELSALPLPLTHKDFNIDLRVLEASRTRGEALDSTQVRTSGRLISEMAEQMLFLGGKTFKGFPIYGYTTHPDRNTIGFGAGVWTLAGTDGEEILTDVLNMIAAAEADRMFGPYWLYVPRSMNTKLDNDFKANSDRTIRERLLMIDGLDSIKAADQLTAGNVVLVQHTMDVVSWVQGEQLQTIQWDAHGGFLQKFKAFQIGVPLVRSDAQARSGVVHMS